MGMHGGGQWEDKKGEMQLNFQNLSQQSTIWQPCSALQCSTATAKKSIKRAHFDINIFVR
jgi:hypothetical protein